MHHVPAWRPAATRAFLRRFRLDRSGLIALKFALAAPVLATLAAGAIDLVAVRAASSRLQTVADAAALAGAPSLSLAADASVARQRAEAFVRAEMRQWPDAPAYQAEYLASNTKGQRALQVTLKAQRPSFFGDLLPPGGWRFNVHSSAAPVNLVPLCVLVTGTSGSKTLNIRDSGKMSAPACMVHSNRDIAVDGGDISAAMIQASTSASGVMTPKANTGAERIDDPFAAMDLDQTRKLSCSVQALTQPKLKVSTGTWSLSPGQHCGGVEASGNARIVLRPGDHFVLGGHLTIKGDARLEGEDVVIFFDKDSKFEFRDHAVISLDGRKTGPYAGLVMGSTRDNTQDFVISADHVENLLGVIYVPAARFVVEGSADVARDSAWTVIVAKALRVVGSPSLFINADYDASPVPVPTGVGPRVGGARLME